MVADADRKKKRIRRVDDETVAGMEDTDGLFRMLFVLYWARRNEWQKGETRSEEAGQKKRR